MRLRIIAYGVGVLLVLLTVSVLTFRAMRPRPYHLPSIELFERVLAATDAETRQRLVDELLEEHQVALTVYAPDGALLVSNVEPPLDEAANGPLPLEDAAQDAPALTLPMARAHALEPPLVPGISFAPLGEQAAPPPAAVSLQGARIVTRPLPPDTTLTGFAAPLLITLAFLVLLSFPVTAAMTRKLDALAEAARRFGEGDLNQRADASRGSDELNRTAQAFNLMAERIGALRQRERALLANVSHELRTPMARMAVLLELSESNPAEATRYQRELGRDLRELEALLERITETFRLDLASPRALERQLARRQAADLQGIAADAAREFSASRPERTLTVMLPEAPVVRNVDEVLLRRAVMNLLDNARKYSPESTTIELRVEASGDIVVSDQGEGIAAEDLPHVFEPFFRADRSRNRHTGGVGLGLGFVRMVARLHDGDVSVVSAPGSGSTFRLRLGPEAEAVSEAT